MLAKEIAGSDLRQVLIRAPIALALVTVVALVLGWLVAGRVLRPLATITAAARQISASNLNERLRLTGPDDELKALGDTLDDLFQPFQRLDPRRAHAGEGHGLGLSIVRAIAAAHGAAIGATARPGGGLAVDVTFPVPVGAGQEPVRDGVIATVPGESRG